MDNLAKDAAAALKAGMSYGRWKAMHSNPVQTEKKIPEGWQECKWCGKPFKPKRSRAQKYCEPDCQYQASYERRKQKIREHKREWSARKKAESASKP